MGKDEFMVVTHYLARVPNAECPAFTVRRPKGGIERCLYDTYAENLAKIIKEASIQIDDTNIEEFLRTRLPMNTQQGTASQAQFGIGNRSQFNLRGLGTNQTLILVDGRRMPGTYGFDTSGTGDLIFNQPDLNGIPVDNRID